jgi:hypothetical protein
MHEIAWHLHSTFIYYLIRKYVYGVPVADDRDGFVAAVVRQFMAGFCTTDEATHRPVSRANEPRTRSRE